MMMKVFAIRDVKSGFLNPTVEMSDDIAVRNFEHAIQCTSKDSLFFTHASDYALYAIGEYDTDSGQILGFDVPRLLLQADAVKVGE